MPHKDETLLLADVGRKALRQVEVLVTQLLERHSPPDRAKVVAHLLAGGVWTHDHPLMAPTLEQLGLPVKIGVPAEERSLMNLYPQLRGRQNRSRPSRSGRCQAFRPLARRHAVVGSCLPRIGRDGPPGH